MTVHDLVFIKEHTSHMGIDFSMTCLAPPLYRTNKMLLYMTLCQGFSIRFYDVVIKRLLVVFYCISNHFNFDIS